MYKYEVLQARVEGGCCYEQWLEWSRCNIEYLDRQGHVLNWFMTYDHQ